MSTDLGPSGLVPNSENHKHEVTSAEGLWNYHHFIEEEISSTVSSLGTVAQQDSGGARFTPGPAPSKLCAVFASPCPPRPILLVKIVPE